MHGFFCYGDEENAHCACTNEHLTTANQSVIREAYHVSVMAMTASCVSVLFTKKAIYDTIYMIGLSPDTFCTKGRFL